MYNSNKKSADDLSDEILRDKLRAELREEIKREFLSEESEQNRSEDDYPWIVFSLDGTEYGVNSRHVLSIEILGSITPLVDASGCCPGITRSRGEMIELLDLRALFGLGDYITAKAGGKDEQYMMMVIETNGVKLGVIVDKIVSVEYITHFENSDVSDSVNTVSSKYIRQIARREKQDKPLLILKPESLNVS